MEEGFTIINNLQTLPAIEWKIRARVSTLWRQHHGLSIIFVDSEGGRIHGRIPAPIMTIFEPRLLEGETYIITNFMVVGYQNNHMNRCFEDTRYIVLTNLTTINTTNIQNHIIPAHIWHFKEIHAIPRFDEQTNHLIDVLGIIESVQPMKHFNVGNNDERKCLQLLITDTMFNIKVTLWNEMADSLETAMEDSSEVPIIIVLSSCKIVATSNQNSKSLTNYPATRLYVNPQDGRVHTLRMRFWEAYG